MDNDQQQIVYVYRMPCETTFNSQNSFSAWSPAPQKYTYIWNIGVAILLNELDLSFYISSHFSLVFIHVFLSMYHIKFISIFIHLTLINCDFAALAIRIPTSLSFKLNQIKSFISFFFRLHFIWRVLFSHRNLSFYMLVIILFV